MDGMEKQLRQRLKALLKEQETPMPYPNVPAARQHPWWIEMMTALYKEELILRRLLS